MLRVFPVIFGVVLAAGCGASMSSDARMDAELNGQGRAEADVEAEASADGQGAASPRPLSQEEADRAHQASFAEAAKPEEPFALFGARHDLEVTDGSSAVSCACVSALLGPPSSGKLKWQGELPRTKPEAQLVVALVPNESGCASGSAGASYWGYRVEGNDVVVLLEEWKAGRPRTLGAIVPKPPASGQVYLAPVAATLPYGKATAGGGARCGLGNPGPARTEGWPPNALAGATEVAPDASADEDKEK
jgi:hypothetical protein